MSQLWSLAIAMRLSPERTRYTPGACFFFFLSASRAATFLDGSPADIAADTVCEVLGPPPPMLVATGIQSRLARPSSCASCARGPEMQFLVYRPATREGARITVPTGKSWLAS